MDLYVARFHQEKPLTTMPRQLIPQSRLLSFLQVTIQIFALRCVARGPSAERKKLFRILYHGPERAALPPRTRNATQPRHPALRRVSLYSCSGGAIRVVIPPKNGKAFWVELLESVWLRKHSRGPSTARPRSMLEPIFRGAALRVTSEESGRTKRYVSGGCVCQDVLLRD
jgi:hypothetical protein